MGCKGMNVRKFAMFYFSWAVAGGGFFDWVLSNVGVDRMLVLTGLLLWVGIPALLLVAVAPEN